MRILTINNTIFYREKDGLFLNKETGHFFVDLLSANNIISVFQINQKKSESDGFANFDVTNKGLKIFTVDRNKNRLIPFIKSFFMINRLVSKNDFIYLFYPGPICMVIAMLCIFYRKPYGIYVRGEQGIFSMISKYILRRAKIVNTISPSFTNHIKSLNIYTYTIRPMISFSESDIRHEKRSFGNDKIKLLYVGRIVFDKGVFELVKAVRNLKENGYNIHLNIVGDGTDKNKLQDLVSSYSLNDDVSFIGMISDKEKLIEIYDTSDIFVLPTYHEGFPRVIYEALIMHMPILTTFVGSIEYLMKDNYNCIRLEVKSIESISLAVEKLIKNPELRNSIAENGKQTIVDYLKDKKMSHAEWVSNFVRSGI